MAENTEFQTSLYFPNYSYENEQDVLDDLICESIAIYGMNMHYVARDLGSYDKIYGEDDTSSYTRAWELAFYLKNVFGYGGDREFMSKVAGLEIRDQIILSVPRRFFTGTVTSDDATITRPREGDLIYFSLQNKCFQIKYVNQFEVFYQLGTLHTWELTCELFEYSSETFNTGIAGLDALQGQHSIDLFDYALRADDGTPLTDENGNILTVDAYELEEIDPISDNDEFDLGLLPLLDWSRDDPFTDFPNRKI